MSKKNIIITLAAILSFPSAIFAAEDLPMKCQNKDCGHEERITLGPTMQSNTVCGYCRACKKFVALSWRYNNLEKPGVGIEPPPKPMGEVWDSKIGSITPIYACPTCKGPFIEIKKHRDLVHCPACNKPEFRVDTSKAGIAVD